MQTGLSRQVPTEEKGSAVSRMLAGRQELHHLAAKHSARDRAFLEIAHSVTHFLL